MIEIYTQWHAEIFDYQRIPIALVAILITMIVGMVSGPLAGNTNSIFSALIDAIFGRFGAKLDRLERKRGDLMLRGLILTAFCVIFSGFIAQLIQKQAFNGGFIDIIAVSVAFSSGTIWFSLLKLYFALEKQGKAAGAYYAISRSCRIDLTSVDDFGITRTGVGHAVRGFDKNMVAPVFWYLIGGLPLLFVYCGLFALSWRFGKDGFSKGFGAVPLALEKLMGFIPSLFTALLITMASLFTPTAKLLAGIASWVQKGNGRAPYEQGGFPVTALAWALSVNLGGPAKDIDGSTLKKTWVGPKGASAKLDHVHLKRAIYINVVAHLLFCCALLVAYMLGSRG